MNNSGSNEMDSSHSEPPPLSHEIPQHPNVQEPSRACGSMDVKDSIDLEISLVRVSLPLHKKLVMLQHITRRSSWIFLNCLMHIGNYF
jgi:hypothetical protein